MALGNAAKLEEPEKIDVNVPIEQAGTIQFMNKDAVKNPAPDKLKRVLTSIRYTLVSLIASVSATDLFTGAQSKIICFSLSIGIIICGGIELGTGVKPAEDK